MSGSHSMIRIASAPWPLRLVACCASLPASIGVAFAQPAPTDGFGDTARLRPIVVTASREPVTLGSEVAATSVITRDDIDRAGVRDLVSALQLLGTAQVEQLGGPGTAAVVRVRGGDSRDTLVLIDGVPLTDVTSGQASISQIPVDWIERIELVRGNVSALYGANATGGVIQIFTRRGQAGLHSQVDVGIGSRNTGTYRAAISGGNEAVRARLGVGGDTSDGFSAGNPSIAPTANPDNDGYRRRDLTLSVDADIAAGHAIGIDLREFIGRVDYDDPSSFGAATDTHVSRTAQRGGALRGRHALGADWALGWRLGRADEHRSDDSVTAFGPSNFGNALENETMAADLTGALGGGWAVQFGAERLKQSTSNATYTVQGRKTDSLRAGTTYRAGWGSLQANVRRDRAGEFGSATTGLLGGTLALGNGFSAIGNIATSFTPPTLDFLYFDCAPFGYSCSNPLLKPERSRTADVGIQWENANSLVRATYFVARYRDKIANDANFIPQNINRAKDHGIELAARTAFDAWRLSGEATIHDPIDEATGQRLARRARQQWVARVDRELPQRVAVGAGVRYVGSRDDTAGQALGAYTVVDLSARWSPRPAWTVQAVLQNAFDKQYQPAAGYNGIPRGLFVTVGWRN
ncbi:TonB-dependent receptor [soil metagenome]